MRTKLPMFGAVAAAIIAGGVDPVADAGCCSMNPAKTGACRNTESYGSGVVCSDPDNIQLELGVTAG